MVPVHAFKLFANSLVRCPELFPFAPIVKVSVKNSEGERMEKKTPGHTENPSQDKRKKRLNAPYRPL